MDRSNRTKQRMESKYKRFLIALQHSNTKSKSKLHENPFVNPFQTAFQKVRTSGLELKVLTKCQPENGRRASQAKQDELHLDKERQKTESRATCPSQSAPVTHRDGRQRTE